jgi:hypothetical protein
METNPFKICTSCHQPWKTREDFLADPELELAGYQVDFEDLEGGLFYFSHLTKGCGTTLAIPVQKFTGLSNRPILTSRGECPGGCPNFCLRRESLDPCPVACECVWVREIMQVILKWEKRPA